MILRHERPADGISMDNRKIAIEHDHVDLILMEPFQCLRSIVGDVDDVSLILESCCQCLRQIPFILDDQKSHPFSPRISHLNCAHVLSGVSHAEG